MDSDVTLADWAGRWLASRVDLKPKTLLGYQSLLRSRIVPALGCAPVGAITPMVVQEWVAAMHRAGLSASRIRQAVHLLGSMLTAAAAEGLVAGNACSSIKLPRLPDNEVGVLTIEEVERLASLTAAPYDVLIRFLAYTGLRFGEAAALRWSRCHLDRGEVTVRESATEVGGRLVFGPTKTHQSRTVALPRFLVSRLSAAEPRPQSPADGFVFTSPRGGPLRYGNFRARVWLPAVVELGRPDLRIHALRHTCASLLIAQGASIKAVQRQLGHRSAELTLDRYGHLYPSELTVLAAGLDAARSAVSSRNRT